MNPDWLMVVAVVVGFGSMTVLLFRTLGMFTATRRKLMDADLRIIALSHENQALRRQMEKDRNEDRASRGDYGTVYNGSYKEVYQSKKTGQWFTAREVSVNP